MHREVGRVAIAGGVQEMLICCTEGYGFSQQFSGQGDLMILEDFSNLGDSVTCNAYQSYNGSPMLSCEGFFTHCG